MLPIFSKPHIMLCDPYRAASCIVKKTMAHGLHSVCIIRCLSLTHDFFSYSQSIFPFYSRDFHAILGIGGYKMQIKYSLMMNKMMMNFFLILGYTWSYTIYQSWKQIHILMRWMCLFIFTCKSRLSIWYCRVQHALLFIRIDLYFNLLITNAENAALHKYTAQNSRNMF